MDSITIRRNNSKGMVVVDVLTGSLLVASVEAHMIANGEWHVGVRLPAIRNADLPGREPMTATSLSKLLPALEAAIHAAAGLEGEITAGHLPLGSHHAVKVVEEPNTGYPKLALGDRPRLSEELTVG